MPSSLLFAGLVATWLAVLVPMAARRRQQTPRPSEAALSCRVLERPRRRAQEVSTMDDAPADHPTGPAAPEPSDHHDREGVHGRLDDNPDREDDDTRARYRPGRGGYDPRAAALAARAKYAFRQRMVLALVLLAVASALVAGGLHLTQSWLVHSALDLCLIGYLVYLRRQVRLEEAIRSRRASRVAGTRRADGAGGPRDERSRRERRPGRRSTVADAVAARDARWRTTDAGAEDEADDLDDEHDLFEDGDASADDGSVAAVLDAVTADEGPALPRLRPVPPPERPYGTVILELDDEDPELHDLDDRTQRGYRRAAGQ